MTFRKVVDYVEGKASIPGIEDSMQVLSFKGADYLVPGSLLPSNLKCKEYRSSAVVYRIVRRLNSSNKVVATDVKNIGILEQLAEYQSYLNFQRNMRGVRHRHFFGEVTVEIL